MAEGSKTRLECRLSALDLQEDIETDVLEDPSPYESDTEEVDIDSFVKSISHDVNDWEIYDVNNFTLEKIGDGFFGDIYKATDSNTGKVFVVKTMKKLTKMKLMCAEIRLMARLKHPNILRFLGVCLDTSGIHLLTEYMEIGNLEEVVADFREPLPWSLRMKLAHDISKGMAYLHSVGVIHRDLASKNVLISSENNGMYTAVIADFGLAAKIPSRKKKLKVVGSPYWMAPEVLRHDQYNETVDIFSYGIILCEIIGRVHSSPEEIPRTNHFGLDVDKFCEIVQGCPPEFLQLAVCCCQLDPQSRPPFELTARFLEYIRQLDIVVGSPTILRQDTLHGSQRMSANIEDWMIDSKKTLETPVKNFPPCDEECVCENRTTPVTNGCAVDAKPAEVNKSDLDATPCRRGHSNKRHSFFAGLRYKYFKPHVDTEDLVKNTPSKLAGFFTRVLHVQKKHKFDGRKKARSKTTNDVVDDRPRLRSFRMILTHKERNASDVYSVENKDISARDCLKPNGVNCSDLKLVEQDNTSSTESPLTTPHGKGTCTSSHAKHAPTGSVYRTSDDESTQTFSPVPKGESGDETDNLSSCENDNPYSMTWSESSFREGVNSSQNADMNGFNDVATPIPRCFSESDVEALRVTTNDKTRTFTPPRQSPQKTKHRKNWNIFSFFQKRGKEKQKT